MSADRPRQFLAELATAMRSTAETARQATIDECRSNAQAYTEYLQANRESGFLHKDAAADITAIRDRSKADIERVREETEQRILRRNEQLEEELQEYTSAVEHEIERVQQSIKSFEGELAQFFDQLLEGGDPTDFATMAANVPDPPGFPEPDPTALVQALRRGGAQPTAAESPAEAAPAPKEALPDHWWLDSPATLAARTHEE